MTQKEMGWYKVIHDSSLYLGDIINNLEFIVEFKEEVDSDLVKVITTTKDIIVLSHTCDMFLERPRLKNIIISPLTPLSEFEKNNPKYTGSNTREAIRRGYFPNLFLLKDINFTNMKKELSIVNFREIFLVKIEKLRGKAIMQGERIRLRSPYREALSHAFGNFFMRVGYPEEIPFFKKGVKVSKFEPNI